MISIVMPVRNGAGYIAEALGSALPEPLLRELIVVDDGSTDDTAAIVTAIGDPRIRLITRPAAHIGGVSAARNLGAAAATGDWLMFLDADDRLRPGALKILLDTARAHYAVAAYGDYRRIDAGGHPIGRRHLLRARRKPDGDILENLLAGNFIVNGGIVLLRTAIFRELGGFDERLRYCEDWYAWCRLAARGRFAYTGAPVLDYRIHQQSVMMNAALTLDDYRPALDAIFSDPLLIGRLPPERRKALRATAEGHLSSYLVAQAVRSHRYRNAAAALWHTIVHYPRQSPRALLISGAALAGF